MLASEIDENVINIKDYISIIIIAPNRKNFELKFESMPPVRYN